MLMPLLWLSACTPPASLHTTLVPVDGEGAAVLGADFLIGEERYEADGRGQIDLRQLQGPVAGVLSAPGYLSEPVVLGYDDQGERRDVRLWSDAHWSLHAGGDVALSRSYLEDGGWLAEDRSAGALQVVEHLAPLFAAADLSLVNLEGPLTDLSSDHRAPGKRYAWATPAEAGVALQVLGVDAVGLANNHSRDYGDDGLRSTRQNLYELGIEAVGAHAEVDRAHEPLVLDVAGVRVGLLGFTTLNGASTNDAYPTDADTAPDEVAQEDTWQWEARRWGAPEHGIALDERRIGSAWRAFRDLEPTLDSDEAADVFGELTAVYPEVQDWVAGRGHGGAAGWDDSAEDQIEALAADVDVVVVMLHAGYESATAPSRTLRRAAARAAEAGADLVIGSNPHALYGAVWLDGALVAHSLGDLVYDHGHPDSDTSAVLRTIWRDDELVHARLVPLELVNNRPIPVADRARSRALGRAFEVSLAQDAAVRDDDDVVVIDSDAPSIPATVHPDGTVTDALPVVYTTELSLRAGEVMALERDQLTDPRLPDAPAELYVARDVFGWGHLEDTLADGVVAGGAHLELNSDWETVEASAGARDHRNVLVLDRSVWSESTLSTWLEREQVLHPHRLYDSAGEPLDPPARYMVRLRARQSGRAEAGLRLVGARYERGSLNTAPQRVGLFDEVFPLEVGGGWRELLLPVDPSWTEQGLNRLGIAVQLAPPQRGNSQLYIDELQLLELRPAAAMPGAWAPYDALYSEVSATVELQELAAP